MPEHNEVMDYLRFFGPVLSAVVIVVGLIVAGIFFWNKLKKKPQTLEGAAAETEGNMTGKDVFNLMMDLRIQSENLERDFKNYKETWGKIEEIVRRDHDKLIRLEAKVDASK